MVDSRKYAISQEQLSQITPRKRAMLKLRLGCGALTPEEMSCVWVEKRVEAGEVKPRTLQEVASFFGITRERVRQINQKSMKKLKLPSE